MIIRDKQDLRKCVKQCVRRAEVIDPSLRYEAFAGGYGIANYLNASATESDSPNRSFQTPCEGSPFAKRPAALLAALDAMQLPVHDLSKAETIIQGFDPQTYFANTLDAMRAKQVLIEIPFGLSDAILPIDCRCVPVLSIDTSAFQPGRYGIDYAAIAQRIAAYANELSAKSIRMTHFNEAALKYCLLPLCEDEGFVLHLHFDSQNEIDAAIRLLSTEFTAVRALLSASDAFEPCLIRAAEGFANILVCLGSLDHLSHALSLLGTHFMPYASWAKTPEEMLGGWVRFKEVFWEAIYDAYLVLARTGYELTREQIEHDLYMLLCGNFEQLYVK